MINKDYLENLNDAQKEAVLHLDGPLLIVAGAGSGKTKVLTSRIANIIKEKRSSNEIKIFNLLILEISFSLLRILESVIINWGLGKKLYFIFLENLKFKPNLFWSSVFSFFEISFWL